MGPPAAKAGDQVVGIDVHIVLVPMPLAPPAPTPLPHPFSGVLDTQLSPDVMIMGLPAATVDSIAHNIPPHLPTPPGVSFAVPPKNQSSVFMGSLSVSINGKPAARLGDMCMDCCDPMDMPVGSIVGTPGTVFIGGPPSPVGMGADGKSATPEAPLDADTEDDADDEPTGVDTSDPKTIKDDHFWEVTVVDSQDKPVSGEEFEAKFPDGKRKTGTLSSDGKVHADGQPSGAGSLQLKGLYEALWGDSTVAAGQAVVMSVDCAAIPDGQTVSFKVFREFLETDSDVVQTLTAKVAAGSAKATFTPKPDPKKDAGTRPHFVFHAVLGHFRAISPPLVVADVVQMAIVDGKGAPVPGLALIARGSDGQESHATTDSVGLVRFEGLAIGPVRVRPAHAGQLKLTE